MVAKRLGKVFVAGCLAVATIAFVAGCERKEKLLDIEAPGIEVEVERNKDTGDVDVEVTRDKGETGQ
jgi:hypothetical protein